MNAVEPRSRTPCLLKQEGKGSITRLAHFASFFDFEEIDYAFAAAVAHLPQFFLQRLIDDRFLVLDIFLNQLLNDERFLVVDTEAHAWW